MIKSLKHGYDIRKDYESKKRKSVKLPLEIRQLNPHYIVTESDKIEMIALEKREFVEFYEAVFSAIKFVIKRYKLNIIAISDKNEAQRLWFDAFMNYSRFELVDRADSTLMDNKSFLSQGSSICEECLRRHLQF